MLPALYQQHKTYFKHRLTILFFLRQTITIDQARSQQRFCGKRRQIWTNF